MSLSERFNQKQEGKKVMGSSDNGQGNKAMNILQTILLAAALGMGGWVVRSVSVHGDDIMKLTYQFRSMAEKLEQMGTMSKGRWTLNAQIQYNSELNSANPTLRVPDVRAIAKENPPQQ